MIEIIAHPFAMMMYGMLANIIGQLANQSAENGGPIHPIKFVKHRPYRLILGVIAGLAGYGALYSTDQLTAISAFGVGYMGTDALSRISDAAKHRFKKL
jgi:hypothetical protein